MFLPRPFISLLLIIGCMITGKTFGQPAGNTHDHPNSTVVSGPPEYSFIRDHSAQPLRIPASETESWSGSVVTASSAAASLAPSGFFGPVNCSGRTRAILSDRSNHSILFACNTTGGIWKSVNSGQYWQPVDDQSEGMNITCIEQSPFDADFLYYGTGERSGRKISGQGTGVYRSTDHGNTFQQLPSTSGNGFKLINSIRHSRTEDSTIFVGTTMSGLQRSQDAGATFQQVFNTGAAVTDVECLPGGAVIIGVSYEGVFISPSGDAGTFVKLAGGLPVSGFSRVEIAWCDSFPNQMYAAFADSVWSFTTGLLGVYRTTNGGVTWTPVNNPGSVGFFAFADAIFAMAVKPNNPQFLLIGGAQPYYSADGGFTYQQLSGGRIDFHTFTFSKGDNDLLYAGNDQGINLYDLSVSPPSLADLTPGYNGSQIWAGSFFPSGNNFLFGAHDNSFYFNRNQDTTFIKLTGYGINGRYAHVHQQQPDTGYIIGEFGKIFRSTNLQSQWPSFSLVLNGLDSNGDGEVDDDTWQGNRVEMNYLNGDQLFLPTRDKVWRSTDAGNTWVPVTGNYSGSGSAPHPYALGMSESLCPVLYCTGINGFFIRIDNACTAVPGSETDLSFSVPSALTQNALLSCAEVHPYQSDILYITASGSGNFSRIWKVTGASGSSPVWTDITGNLDNRLQVHWVVCHPDHPDSVLFAGTDLGLWQTDDGGQTWSREVSVPLVPVYQMRIRKSDKKLIVFTYGRGIWTASLNSTGTGIAESDAPVSLLIKPNPGHSVFEIDAGTISSEDAPVYIYDMSGRLLHRSTIVKGTAKVRIDLSDFSIGVYLVKVLLPGGVLEGKLIRQ